MLRKRTVRFSEGLTVLGFDNNNSNRDQESSPNKESIESSDDFSANKLITSKKMAQIVVFHVRRAPEEAFEGHVIDQKNIHPANSKLAY